MPDLRKTTPRRLRRGCARFVRDRCLYASGKPESGKPEATFAEAPAAIILSEAGELRRGDRRLDSGEFVDSYRFRGRRGQRVSIELSSSDFDTYVILIPPSGAQQDNDDRGDGGSTDSRIETALAVDGEIRGARHLLPARRDRPLPARGQAQRGDGAPGGGAGRKPRLRPARRGLRLWRPARSAGEYGRRCREPRPPAPRGRRAEPGQRRPHQRRGDPRLGPGRLSPDRGRGRPGRHLPVLLPRSWRPGRERPRPGSAHVRDDRASRRRAPRSRGRRSGLGRSGRGLHWSRWRAADSGGFRELHFVAASDGPVLLRGGSDQPGRVRLRGRRLSRPFPPGRPWRRRRSRWRPDADRGRARHLPAPLLPRGRRHPGQHERRDQRLSEPVRLARHGQRRRRPVQALSQEVRARGRAGGGGLRRRDGAPVRRCCAPRGGTGEG